MDLRASTADDDDMSFLLAYPPDGRYQYYPNQRDIDELPVPRQTATHRSSRSAASDVAVAYSESAPQSAAAGPLSGPSIPRKNIVFPDPVAFR